MTIADFYLLLEIKDKTGDDLFVDPWTLGNLRNDMDDIPLLRTLFICQMAIWSVTCFFHIFVAERQSDYLVMLGHHLATIGAIGIAYKFGFVRFGLIILFLHDCSDIPVGKFVLMV